MGRYLLSFLALAISLHAQLRVEKTPCALSYLPEFTIEANRKPLFTGDRARFASCTSVAWTVGDSFLFAPCLLASALQIYSFDSETGSLCPSKYIDGREGWPIGHPISIDFSRDGSMMAMTNSLSGSVAIYEMGADFAAKGVEKLPKGPSLVVPDPVSKVVHGVRFSADSRYFAYTCFAPKGFIRLYRLEKNGSKELQCSLIQSIDNPQRPMKPKGVAFSPNGKFVAICYSENAKGKATPTAGAVLIYPFDAAAGRIHLKSVSSSYHKTLSTPEDVCFHPDGHVLFVSNQGNDSIVQYSIDPTTGQLGRPLVALQNPTSNLSFPHGIACSTDGRYLGVSNHGDNKTTVYRIYTEQDSKDLVPQP